MGVRTGCGCSCSGIDNMFVLVSKVVVVEGCVAVLEPSLEARQLPHYMQRFATPETDVEVAITCILLKTQKDTCYHMKHWGSGKLFEQHHKQTGKQCYYCYIIVCLFVYNSGTTGRTEELPPDLDSPGLGDGY